MLHGEGYIEEKPKIGFNLDQVAEDWLANNTTGGFPTFGDPSKGNLNDLLRSNILRCKYFKVDLYELKTYHEVINEIEIHVGYVEPWTIGTHGVPSTIFCCLYKLMLMHLSMKQVYGLVKEGNPFTRCCGFLYIRYLCKPELLYHFLSPYLVDDQEFQPTPSSEEILTIGEYVERLLSDQNYYTTILPRTPALIDKEIQKRLLLLPEKRERRKENLKHINEFKIDDPVYFMDFENNDWKKATCTAVSPEGINIYYQNENGAEIEKLLDLSEVLP